ncbi:unnamed protein product [Caenorhabditis angaria]|uniref:Uncharacterized protein n=1 Tax=Caenorhabditis angaria TaxID=860376 RepID=A0A9P1IRF2_9PELO|nr:unnamed protein product [Caenorhabditis angaria]
MAKSNSSKVCALICHLNVRLGLAICGILLGAFWSVIYIAVFKNWIALSASLLSVLFAFLTLYIYILQKCNIFESKLSPKTRYILMVFNAIFMIFSVVAFFMSIIFAIVLKQGVSVKDQFAFSDHSQNLWSTCTWFLILFKWTLQNTLILRFSLKSA